MPHIHHLSMHRAHVRIVCFSNFMNADELVKNLSTVIISTYTLTEYPVLITNKSFPMKAQPKSIYLKYY